MLNRSPSPQDMPAIATSDEDLNSESLMEAYLELTQQIDGAVAGLQQSVSPYLLMARERLVATSQQIWAGMMALAPYCCLPNMDLVDADDLSQDATASMSDNSIPATEHYDSSGPGSLSMAQSQDFTPPPPPVSLRGSTSSEGSVASSVTEDSRASSSVGSSPAVSRPVTPLGSATGNVFDSDSGSEENTEYTSAKEPSPKPVHRYRTRLFEQQQREQDAANGRQEALLSSIRRRA